MKQFRQGDVLLTKISFLPEGLKKKEYEKKIILAIGEATGHHHSVEVTETTESFVDEAGILYLKFDEQTILEHQEHAPITLPEGIYIVTTQIEYTPTEIRNVKD